MNRKITIQYEKDPEYRLIPAQGAWVGMCPTGDLVIDLYVERPTPPEEVLIEVEPPNIVREVERRGERQVRRLMAGLTMRPDLAWSLGRWLQEKAEAAGYKPPSDPDKH